MESQNILNLSEADFGLMTRWLTGHCFLARHEAIINNTDPTCNKCFLDDQTLWHLLKDCPATLPLRSNLPHDQWTTGTLLKLIKQIDFSEVFTDSLNPYLLTNYKFQRVKALRAACVKFKWWLTISHILRAVQPKKNKKKTYFYNFVGKSNRTKNGN